MSSTASWACGWRDEAEGAHRRAKHKFVTFSCPLTSVPSLCAAVASWASGAVPRRAAQTASDTAPAANTAKVSKSRKDVHAARVDNR
jgi:hypothetical protein